MYAFLSFFFLQKEGPVEKKVKDAEKELLNDWAILRERKGCGLEFQILSVDLEQTVSRQAGSGSWKPFV